MIYLYLALWTDLLSILLFSRRICHCPMTLSHNIQIWYLLKLYFHTYKVYYQAVMYIFLCKILRHMQL